jgi:DNA-binding CsgD family transcriptional regulator
VSFDAIVAAIYDAALDPGRWPAALGLINAELGSVACGLRYQSFATGAFWQTWHDLEPDFERAYVEHYFRMDPWVEKALSLREGEALYSEEAVPRRELERTVFFNELCKPFEMQDLVGGILVRTPDELVTFGAMRRVSSEAFGEADARSLARLLPHLRRAYEMQRRLGGAERMGAAGWAAIDALPASVILLDGNNRVVRTNRAADRLLGSGQALTVEDGELACVAPRGRSGLTLLLEQGRGGAPVPIERAGRRPLLGSSMPLGAAGSLVEANGGGRLLVLVDPDADPTTPSEVLERLFGLTRSEAKVALLIGGGRAPKEAAQQTGRTWNTVRDQLKQVYAKTSTTGQTGLVRLVGGLGLLPSSQGDD